MLNPCYIPVSPYPTHVFSSMLRLTIQELQRNTLAPEAMIGMEVLSAMSAVAQVHYDYESATGSVRPVSLNTLVIADSGERKTSVHNLVAKPIYAFDEARMVQYKKELAEFDTQQHIWTTRNTGLHRQLRKLVENQKPTDEVEQAIVAHGNEKPIKPQLRRFIRQNLTERAFMESIEGDGEAITCMSDEGEILIKGGMFRFMGLMNKGWDGASMLTMDRSDGVSIVARNPRVAVSILVQHSVFKELIEGRGEQLRGSGHWARYLVGFPESTQGRRFTNKLNHDWVDLPIFHAKMKSILDEFAEQKKAGNNTRKVLQFSDDAKQRCLELVNRTEQLISPWGYFSDIKDAASKAVEVMGRIAALVHIFSDKEEKISLASLNSAVQIYDWHAGEFKRLFSSAPELSEAEQDAEAIIDFLVRDVWNSGANWIKKNDLRNYGPARSKLRLNDALELLMQRNVVWLAKDIRRTSIVNLVPSSFPFRLMH